MRSSCRTSEPRAFAVAAACVLALLAGAARGQDTGPDRAGALVVFPLVRVDSAGALDTFLRLGNSSGGAVDVRCFIEDATSHCSNTNGACTNDADCPVGGVCVASWTISDFSIRLTPGQPVEWRASQGLTTLPAPGNQGSIIPVPEDPFVGAMRCFVVDGQTNLPPVPGGPENDALEGVATIERAGAAAIELARYRAIGFPSFGNDGDGTLDIGLEYGPCPFTLTLSHFFENAVEPAAGETSFGTELAVVPCRADYGTQTPVADVVHLNVVNEFEQRIGLSARLGPQLFASLTRLHPTVFDVGVQGSLAGQTRINDLGGGVIGLAIQSLSDSSAREATSARGLYQRGAQPQSDLIVLPQ